MTEASDLYFVHISIHGLIRGKNLELGRDADTGGQCKYVVELVEALSKMPQVGQVDLLTRRIIDPKVSADYGEPVEQLSKNAHIRRIEAGPRRYIRKEALWRYLDVFVDQALALFRQNRRLPDIIHAHYADAGYVGSRLASLLGCPFIFTGHSLGRTKREQLLAQRSDPALIERRYNLNARIEAEELSLDTAALVCTSSQQEVEQQYSLYERYAPARLRVIPPGVDVSRFSPPIPGSIPDDFCQALESRLRYPERPPLLAIARADEKKNLATLVRAFGQHPNLRHRANLILIAGNRDRIADLDPGARRVWTELLQLIDDYELHSCVAAPKRHSSDEIPLYYRYAASRKGLFVNPALTEPFGLTLIEAAASGLPVVATHDGGPRDIIGNCDNGLLIDPLNADAMGEALFDALSDPTRWEKWSANGLAGVDRHYTWKGHVLRYLEESAELLSEITQPHLITEKIRSSLPLKDRMLFTGLDDKIHSGDPAAIERLADMFGTHAPTYGFGIASGRSLSAARELVGELRLPDPDVYITQLGAEIHYGKRLVKDLAWETHLAHNWNPNEIRQTLEEIPGLTLQEEPDHQHRFKISYHLDSKVAPRRREIQRLLRKRDLPAKVILSQSRWLDVIPVRSGKGHAIRYLAMRWGLPADRILYYARRGSDYEALSGQFLAVIGSDHSIELTPSTNLPRVYLAKKPSFSGLLEGIDAYHFDDVIQVPLSARGVTPESSDVGEAVLAPDLSAHPSHGE